MAVRVHPFVFTKAETAQFISHTNQTITQNVTRMHLLYRGTAAVHSAAGLSFQKLFFPHPVGINMMHLKLPMGKVGC